MPIPRHTRVDRKRRTPAVTARRLGSWLLIAMACAPASASGPAPIAPVKQSPKPSQHAGAAHDWPMFRGDNRQTGIVRGHLPKKLGVLWKFEIDEAFTGTAAIVHGVVYIGGEDGVLYAINLATGKEKWRYTTDDVFQSSPAVVDGLVLLGDGTGTMHAVDASSGKKRWTFSAQGQIISSVNFVARGGGFADGKAVFGSYDGFVYCLDIKTGKLVWKFETAGRVHGTPAIADGYVLGAGCDEYLHVIRLSDGVEIRSISMQSVSGASAAVRGDHVFVGTYGNQVLAIDWKKGTVAWRFEEGEHQFPFMSSAAVTKGLVMLGGRDKGLHALDPDTGQQRWVFRSQGRVESSPVVVDSRVFFGSSDGHLYELNADTGKESWRFDAASPIDASPAVAEERLVIGTVDGVLYCFGAKPNR